jgi:hypothetical protein
MRNILLCVYLSATAIVSLSGCSQVVGRLLNPGTTVAGNTLASLPLQRFVPPGSHFAVGMPGSPGTVKSEFSNGHRYVIQDDNISLGVSEEPLPAYFAAIIKDPLRQQAGLDGACTGSVTAMGGKERSRVAINLGGGRYPGREFEGTLPKRPNGVFRYRVFIDANNNRLFQVGAVGYSERVNSSQIAKFLDSFEILP